MFWRSEEESIFIAEQKGEEIEFKSLSSLLSPVTTTKPAEFSRSHHHSIFIPRGKEEEEEDDNDPIPNRCIDLLQLRIALRLRAAPRLLPANLRLVEHQQPPWIRPDLLGSWGFLHQTFVSSHSGLFWTSHLKCTWCLGWCRREVL